MAPCRFPGALAPPLASRLPGPHWLNVGFPDFLDLAGFYWLPSPSLASGFPGPLLPGSLAPCWLPGSLAPHWLSGYLALCWPPGSMAPCQFPSALASTGFPAPWPHTGFLAPWHHTGFLGTWPFAGLLTPWHLASFPVQWPPLLAFQLTGPTLAFRLPGTLWFPGWCNTGFLAPWNHHGFQDTRPSQAWLCGTCWIPDHLGEHMHGPLLAFKPHYTAPAGFLAPWNHDDFQDWHQAPHKLSSIQPACFQTTWLLAGFM